MNLSIRNFNYYRELHEFYAHCRRCQEFAFLLDGICGNCGDDLRQERQQVTRLDEGEGEHRR